MRVIVCLRVVVTDLLTKMREAAEGLFMRNIAMTRRNKQVESSLAQASQFSRAANAKLQEREAKYVRFLVLYL